MRPNHPAEELESYLGDPLAEQARMSFRRSVELDEEDAYPAEAVSALGEWGFLERFVPVSAGGRLERFDHALRLLQTVSRRDLTAAIALAFKAVVIPVTLHRIVRRLGIHREIETVVGIGLTMLAGMALVALAMVVMLRVTPEAVPLTYDFDGQASLFGAVALESGQVVALVVSTVGRRDVQVLIAR